MAALNLTANGKEQERILAYLQENASEVLIEKINNGIPIEKDGKTLINKKTLDGFMSFACEEARKQAEKGAQAACVDDATVFGWAIHYFEEESIEGNLYNGDGTVYEPPKFKKKAKPTTSAAPYTPLTPKPKPQMSIFDMLDGQPQPEETSAPATEETDRDDEQPAPEEIQEILAEQEESRQAEPKTGNSMYQKYMNIQAHYPDSIIAYRVGDFYEVFGKNAVMIAEEFDLTLTGRDCGLTERVPMVGFPFHASDVYIEKIVRRGHKIAIAEDLDTVRTIAPALSEQPVDKETGELLSPAAIEDDILANEREIAKAFDKDALLILSDLLGEIFILG